MKGFGRTFLLMAVMTALFMSIGGLIGGQQGALIALGIAAIMNVFSYWNSDKMVLAYYKAQPADEAAAPGLLALVDQLSRNASIPTPKTYIIHNDQPNAFATGRNPENAAVAVTTGLMQRLTMAEIAGVIAHELAHIKNHDTLTMTITATLAGAIGMLGNMAMFMGGGDRDGRRNPIIGLVIMIVAPIAAMLVQMAISRSREYEADRIGAEICGKPLWLADALEKIAGNAHAIDNHEAERNPATAHMFIINPLHLHAVDGLFATHPSTVERVRRLRAMAGV